MNHWSVGRSQLFACYSQTELQSEIRKDLKYFFSKRNFVRILLNLCSVLIFT